jgi:hypothetical protein
MMGRRVLWTWAVCLGPGLLVAGSCARTLQRPVDRPSATERRALWRAPSDLESRDLFHGVGGAALAPRLVTYNFMAKKKTGTNPGYDVRDPQGRLWSVKLGDEAQSEVATSRILWAIGFHQPPIYYIKKWRLSGADEADQPPGRFRLELPSHAVVGEWSRYENPFIGSRQFAALITVNLLLNNWDLKTPNNRIYVVTDQDGVRDQWYVVRDLGASLGKAHQPRFLTWFPFMRQKQGSKNTVEDFESQGFVKAVQGESVDFDYRGLDKAWPIASLPPICAGQSRYRHVSRNDNGSTRSVPAATRRISAADTFGRSKPRSRTRGNSFAISRPATWSPMGHLRRANDSLLHACPCNGASVGPDAGCVGSQASRSSRLRSSRTRTRVQ